MLPVGNYHQSEELRFFSTCITSVAHLTVISASVVVTREEQRLFYFQQNVQVTFSYMVIFFFNQSRP